VRKYPKEQNYTKQKQDTDENYDHHRSGLGKCTLGIVGSMSQTLDGNKYVLTFQDELPKYILATPIKQQDTMQQRGFL